MEALEYYSDENTEMVKRTFDIDEMLNVLLKHGLINKIEPDYCDNVLNMCNNCCIILGQHLTIFALPQEIKVCEGVFNMMGNHTWLNLDGIIFDATLAQFIPSAPKLAILKENNHYQVVRTYTLSAWRKIHE